MSALNRKMISITSLLLILVCMDSFSLSKYIPKVTHKRRGPLIKKIINTASAAAPVGPYSQAVVVGRMIYISGQLGINATTGELVDGGVEPQTTQALNNMGAILAAAGANFTNVVKTTLVLADINDIGSVNDIYQTFFPSKFPARASFQAAALPAGALVEIEAIAVLGPLPRKRRPRPFPRKYRPRTPSRKYRPPSRKYRPRPPPRKYRPRPHSRKHSSGKSSPHHHG